MQAVEKLTDIPRLRAQLRPRRLDDRRVQPQPLRDVDARRRSRHADPQLIRRLQCGFIESDRRVHHPGRIGAEYFQRSVMGGDHGDASDPPEVFGDGHRQRRSFFRIGGRSQFIQQHQRMRRGRSGNEINVGHVGRECRKILLDGLVVADIGQHRIKYGQLGAVRGNWNAGLRHQRQQAHGFQGNSFSAGVWTGDDQFKIFAFEFDADRNDLPTLGFQVSLQQRVAGVDQNQPSGARPGQPWAAVPTWFLLVFNDHYRHAVVVFGETRLGELQLQFPQHPDRLQDQLRVFADPPRHLDQDAVNLGQFFIQQPH